MAICFIPNNTWNWLSNWRKNVWFIIKVKKEKAVKGPKILKYGNREEINIKEGEDE